MLASGRTSLRCWLEERDCVLQPHRPPRWAAQVDGTGVEGNGPESEPPRLWFRKGDRSGAVFHYYLVLCFLVSIKHQLIVCMYVTCSEKLSWDTWQPVRGPSGTHSSVSFRPRSPVAARRPPRPPSQSLWAGVSALCPLLASQAALAVGQD